MFSVVAALIGTTLLAGQVQAAQPGGKSTLQRIKASGQILVAHRVSSVPFSYLDANGRPIGYSIDLCARIIEAVRRELRQPGLRVIYVPVDSASRISRLLDGTADIECGGTTNTESRRRQVAFSVTHFFAGGRLLVRSGSAVKDVFSLRNAVVATTKGSTHLRYLEGLRDRGLTKSRIVPVDDPAAGLAAVETGAADAFLFDDVVLYALKAGSKDPKSLAIVGNWTTAEPLALMFRKDDPEFKRLVDTTLSRSMIDGEVNAIYARWFKSPIPPDGIALNIELSALLRDQFRFPTDAVGDMLVR